MRTMSRTPARRSFGWQRHVAHLRHARVTTRDRSPAARARCRGVTSSVGIVDPRLEVLDRVEHERRAGVHQQLRRRSRRLHHRTLRAEVATEHRDPGLGDQRVVERTDHRRVAGRAAVATTSRIGVPDTVSASPSSRSTRAPAMTAGRPPASKKSSIRRDPAGMMSTSSGKREPMRSKSSSVERDADPAGEREEVDHRVGRAADRRQDADGVLERRHRVRTLLGRRSSPHHLRRHADR